MIQTKGQIPFCAPAWERIKREINFLMPSYIAELKESNDSTVIIQTYKTSGHADNFGNQKLKLGLKF